MTTPAQPQQQPSQGQQTALALAAAAALAGALTVPAALATLGPVFAAQGIKRRALEGALEVVMGHPPDAAGFYGPATSQVARLNLIRRAQFLVASARRFQGDITSAVSRNQPLLPALRAAIIRERRFYGQQLLANWTRERAAAQVDSASREEGRLLGWYTLLDSKTSLECIEANGRNFYADQMPAIGWPGAVHPYCRCRPGPPFPGARLVGQPFRRKQPAYA
jgi:hypothetical protein